MPVFLKIASVSSVSAAISVGAAAAANAAACQEHCQAASALRSSFDSSCRELSNEQGRGGCAVGKARGTILRRRESLIRQLAVQLRFTCMNAPLSISFGLA
jgi:hypothetical protein